MPRIWRLPLALSVVLLLPALARSQEARPAEGISSFDTEHIFGFAEGSDIGDKGEREIESITIGSFGAPVGGYADADNETSFRYNVTDDLRLSIGTLTDYFNIHDVPGLNDRSALDFSGIITEARWHILDWRTSPFGMTISVNPLWRRTDPTSGQSQENYAVPVTLLVDKELIPSKFFTVFNLIYGPSFQRLNPHWEHDDSFTILRVALTPLRQTFSSAPRFVMRISPKMETSTRMHCSSARSSTSDWPRVFQPRSPGPRKFRTSRPTASILRIISAIKWSCSSLIPSNRSFTTSLRLACVRDFRWDGFHFHPLG